MNYYVQELLKKWNIDGSVTIGVNEADIKPSRRPNPDYQQVLDLLQRCKNSGAKIIVLTDHSSDRYSSILTWISASGLNIDGINRYVGLNIILDHRGGLSEAFDVLEETLDMFGDKIFTH